MSGAHRKPGGPVPGPGTFLVRPVDSATVKAAIAGEIARAINETAESLRKVREWCDAANTIFCSHGEVGPYNCERCEAIKDCADAVRSLLPPVPEAAEEAQQ